MEDENKDVKEGEVETPEESSALENEQDEKSSDIQENLRRAIEQEKEELRKLREEKKQVRQSRQEPQQVDQNADPALARFLRAEADAQLAKKLAVDPSFRERVDLVEEEMVRSGRSLEDADNAVLARIFKEATQGRVEIKEPNKPKQQLKTDAVPEPEISTGAPNYRDIMRGKVDSEDAKLLRSVIQRVKGS